MAERFAVGIDLGTSTSEIAVYRRDGLQVVPDWKTKSPIIPSIVGVDKHGVIQVGEDARTQVHQLRGTQEIKRLMGTDQKITLADKEYTPEELSAVLLTYLKRSAEEYVGEKITQVAISVPANFTEPQRRATTRAAELAGLSVLRIVNEPTAAALAFGYHNAELEGQIAVFDFGGGTLDVSVLEMMEGVLEVKATYGDTKLGGTDFDDAMIEILRRKFLASHPTAEIGAKSQEALKTLAQIAKMSLSTSMNTDVNLSNFAQAQGDLVDLDVTVSRQEFEQAIQPLLMRARECVKTALAAKGFRPEHIDRVLLVGGTTYIPAVRALAAQAFGKEPVAGVSPDLAVVMGTALRAAAAQEMLGEDAPVLADVCSFGLGTDVMVRGDGELTYSALIAPNTPIPYSTSRVYSLLQVNQTDLTVTLIQSHDGKAKFVRDGLTVRSERLTNIPPSRTGVPHDVVVDFSYDVDGLARLTATIAATGQRAEMSHAMVTGTASSAGGSRSTVGIAVANMAGPQGAPAVPGAGGEAWQNHPYAAQYEPLIDRASAYMGDGRVVALVNRLKRALADRNDSQLDDIADSLTDLIFDLTT